METKQEKRYEKMMKEMKEIKVYTKMQLKRKIAVSILLAIIVIMAYLSWNSWLTCSETYVIPASLTVKTIADRQLLGFTTENDALKFGVISPGVTVHRKVEVQRSEQALVSVTMKGDIAPWAIISPSSFTIAPGELVQVSFDIAVPIWAHDGNVTGKAVFCFT